MIELNLEKALNAAYHEAQSRMHEYVTVEHLLFAFCNNELGKKIITNSGGDLEKITAELRAYLEMFEAGPELAGPELKESPEQTVALQRVLRRAIVHGQSSQKKEIEIGDVLAAVLEERENEGAYFLQKWGVERLSLLTYISHEMEEEGETNVGQGDGQTKEENPGKKNLEKYTTNMTQMAAEGRYDSLIGREEELKRTIEILCRRQKNNPIHVGDPGVGKTAITQGLAQMIVQGEAPERLKGFQIFSLDMGLLLAGTKYRGDFEARLKSVVNELKRLQKVVLFIDEIHTIIGAGAVGGGSMDASNILKPLLTTGEMRCIGATTYEEYRKYFEKERALSRRFQKVEVREPGLAESIEILEGLKGRYESFHGVKYDKKAIEACVEMSVKYLKESHLPDKAIDLMDEAGSVASVYRKERARITAADIEELAIRASGSSMAEKAKSEGEALKGLEERLQKKIFGQDKAIKSLAASVKRGLAGLSSEERPVASFLFVGPTGVGKTELTRALAEELGLVCVRFDMSEFAEKHTVSRLLGSPPGYVGYDEGAKLTEEIRKNPRCVLLMDEIEKAHPDIYNILLQVMDRATITDNNGRSADFQNVILVMTSNAGSREISSLKIGFAAEGDENMGDAGAEVRRLFSPEFLNRLDEVIQFKRLNQNLMEKIVLKEVGKIKERLKGRKVALTIAKPALRELARLGYSPGNGARPVERLLQEKIQNPVADEILFGRLSSGGKAAVVLDSGGKIVVTFE